jgi:membrane fusion protein, multidrug efflux system
MSAAVSRLVFALAVAVLLELPGCSGEEHKQTALPPRPVLAIRVEPKTVEVFGPFTGTVQPRYQTSAGFQTSGRIITRDVTVGDLVKAGERLASLDPRLARFALGSAQAEVANARATLINAQATEARQRALLASGTGGTTQALADTAIANRQTSEARLAQAEAALDKAKQQLAYTELRAEYDGVISSWEAEVGQFVAAGQAAVTIARPDIREAVFDVPAEHTAGLHASENFTVALLTAASISTTGTVREITPIADPSTRTQRIRLSLSEPPQSFRLGTMVSISLPRAIPPVIEIPATAVLERDGKTSVWIVAPGGTVEARPVSIAGKEGGRVEVRTGLSKGDIVVTAGVHSLSPGQAVRVTEGPSA